VRAPSCSDSCETGYEAGWNNDVKPIIEKKCGFEDSLASFQSLLASTEAVITELEYDLIRQEILCLTYTPACGWANTTREAIGVAEALRDSIQDSIDDYLTWISDLVGDIFDAKASNDQWYVDCMAYCCTTAPTPKADEAMASFAIPDPYTWRQPGYTPEEICVPLQPGFTATFNPVCLSDAYSDHKDCWNAPGGPKALSVIALDVEATLGQVAAIPYWASYFLAVDACREALEETLYDDSPTDCCKFAPLMPGLPTELAIEGYIKGTNRLHPDDVYRFQMDGTLPLPYLPSDAGVLAGDSHLTGQQL
tara:strand:+ start:41684 stop:42607 length:924 start_codon:yes stop_codon:yes gene_type:complete